MKGDISCILLTIFSIVYWWLFFKHVKKKYKVKFTHADSKKL